MNNDPQTRLSNVELAYLTGKEDRFAAVVLLNLIEAGFLIWSEKQSKFQRLATHGKAISYEDLQILNAIDADCSWSDIEVECMYNLENVRQRLYSVGLIEIINDKTIAKLANKISLGILGFLAILYFCNVNLGKDIYKMGIILSAVSNGSLRKLYPYNARDYVTRRGKSCLRHYSQQSYITLNNPDVSLSDSYALNGTAGLPDSLRGLSEFFNPIPPLNTIFEGNQSQTIDRYDLAYLSGGEARVAAVVIINLIESGHLSWNIEQKMLIKLENALELPDLEQNVLDIITDDGSLAEVRASCKIQKISKIRQRLTHKGLIREKRPFPKFMVIFLLMSIWGLSAAAFVSLFKPFLSQFPILLSYSLVLFTLLIFVLPVFTIFLFLKMHTVWKQKFGSQDWVTKDGKKLLAEYRRETSISRGYQHHKLAQSVAIYGIKALNGKDFLFKGLSNFLQGLIDLPKNNNFFPK